MMTEGLIEELAALVEQRRQLPEPEERRRCREEARVSVRELARAMRVSPQSVLEWERGRTPRPELAERYLAALKAMRGAS